MKKIILFIIFSLGLLFNYYVGYKETHAAYQDELIKAAVESNDNEFFLKFNELYNSEYIYYNATSDGTIYVYESNTADVDYYNFIIKGLDVTKLEIIDYDNDVVFKINGANGTVEMELYASYYIASSIYLVTVPTEVLLDKIGEKITSLSFDNQSNETLFNFNTNIDVVEELNTTNYKNGYTNEELTTLYTFDSLSNVYVSLAIYTSIYAAAVLIFFGILHIIKKRNGTI